MVEEQDRWRLRLNRLVFVVPVAVIVVWEMAAGARQETPWESRQRLLGAITLVCLGATSLAPRRIALGLLTADIALVVVWLLAVVAQGLS